MSEKSQAQTSRVCKFRDYESQCSRRVSKSGVPDCERKDFLKSNFQDVGAKSFKVLSSTGHKMQDASCVGVNNIDCETQENEREVAPFFCASRGNVDRLGTSRPRGGRWVGGGGVEMFPCCLFFR